MFLSAQSRCHNYLSFIKAPACHQPNLILNKHLLSFLVLYKMAVCISCSGQGSSSLCHSKSNINGIEIRETWAVCPSSIDTRVSVQVRWNSQAEWAGRSGPSIECKPEHSENFIIPCFIQSGSLYISLSGLQASVTLKVTSMALWSERLGLFAHVPSIRVFLFR